MRLSSRRARRASSLGLLALVALPAPLAAQRPADPVARRYTFAELFVGGDVQQLPGVSDGALDVPGRVAPRLTIGGLHFWGHADFAVTFPVGLATRGEGATRSMVSTGVETRGRWYVRPRRGDGLSPFVGGGLGGLDLEVGDGPLEARLLPMVQAGLVWRRGGMLYEAGWSARPRTSFTYPTSRTSSAVVTPSSHAIFVGAHRLFETTRGLEPLVKSGAWGRREARLRSAGKLSGPSLAIGVSSPILTGSSAYTRTERPFLSDRAPGAPMLDLGLGWYHDGLDAHVNLAWRRARFESEAFAFTQAATRRSIALEAFKFLGDYHGFVPFVGPVVSLERLAVEETDAGQRVTDVSRNLVAPGVTFGWDIRPTRAQSWILRTNLRWFPNLRVPLENGTHSLDQLEFNFIQLVWYPGR
jgi:hypothetical protein